MYRITAEMEGERPAAPRRPIVARRGVAVVEAAFVVPLALFLLIGLIVTGLGMFRSHIVTSTAREAARWAATRGTRFQQLTGQSRPTATDVYENVIRPMTGSLDPARLQYSVNWRNEDREVVVKLDYQWLPEAYFPAATLSSTSVMPTPY